MYITLQFTAVWRLAVPVTFTSFIRGRDTVSHLLWSWSVGLGLGVHVCAYIQKRSTWTEKIWSLCIHLCSILLPIVLRFKPELRLWRYNTFNSCLVVSWGVLKMAYRPKWPWQTEMHSLLFKKHSMFCDRRKIIGSRSWQTLVKIFLNHINSGLSNFCQNNFGSK